MKNGKLGFGIIGCGDIALTHRAAIEACAEAQLVAVCDVAEERARRFVGGEDGIRTYRDHEKPLRAPRSMWSVSALPRDFTRTA